VYYYCSSNGTDYTVLRTRTKVWIFLSSGTLFPNMSVLLPPNTVLSVVWRLIILTFTIIPPDSKFKTDAWLFSLVGMQTRFSNNNNNNIAVIINVYCTCIVLVAWLYWENTALIESCTSTDSFQYICIFTKLPSNVWQLFVRYFTHFAMVLDKIFWIIFCITPNIGVNFEHF